MIIPCKYCGKLIDLRGADTRHPIAVDIDSSGEIVAFHKCKKYPGKAVIKKEYMERQLNYWINNPAFVLRFKELIAERESNTSASDPL